MGALTCATNVAHALGRAPVLATSFGSAVLPLRYVSWMHTTPALVTLMAHLCSVQRPHAVTLAIVADVIMLITGLLGTLVRSLPLAIFFMLLSTACMAVVLRLVWRWFSDAITAAPRGSLPRSTLTFVRRAPPLAASRARAARRADARCACSVPQGAHARGVVLVSERGARRVFRAAHARQPAVV